MRSLFWGHGVGRTIGTIIATLGAAALIATGIGAAAGLALFGTTVGISVAGVSLGTLLLASSVLTAVGGLLKGTAKSPKPAAAESQIRNPAAPRLKGYGTRRAYGSVVFFGTASDGSAVDVVAYVDCPANSVERVYLNDDQVTISGGVVQQLADKSYSQSKVLAGFNLGATPNTAHAAVISKLPGIWTTAHRGDGVVSGYLIKQPVKQKDFLEVYPQGDSVEMSLVIDMQPCFDPRNPAHSISNPDTWEATENGVLQLLHYFVFEQGYDYTTRILPKIALWNAAANVCDQTISGEARYRSCILYDKTAQPKEVIGSILETFDGWYAVNSENQIEIYAGAYYTPTVSIGPSHIVDYSVQTFVEDENKLNEVTVKYISDLHDYNEVEAQPWRLEDDISERGRVVNTSISPQIPSFKQGRRLAKILVARENAPNRGTVTTNFAGRIAENQRFINLEIEEAGAVLFDGVAEIVAITRNLETGGITFEWRSADPNAWAWNPATEDGYGAPTGDFPTLDALTAPTINSVTAQFDAVANTAVFTVDGTGPDRADLTWFLRWKYSVDSVWNEQRYDDIAPGASVALATSTIPINTDIDIQIAYSIGTGQVSPWSATFDANADTESDPPGAAGAVVLDEWEEAIRVSTASIPRATSYVWKFYLADGTTLKRTITTATRNATYSLAQAAADGVAREYKVTVQGQNTAGTGTASAQLTITNPAPDAPTGVSATDGDYSTTVTYTPTSGANGHVIYYSTTTGFNPKVEGRFTTIGNSGTYIIDNLAPDTYYFIVGALDKWTQDPDFLNFSAESDFTIAIGGGGSGGDGGGYDASPPTFPG